MIQAPICHRAAEPEGLEQRCADCGETLIDYTDTMMPESGTIGFWTVDAYVLIEGNGQSIATPAERQAYRCLGSAS